MTASRWRGWLERVLPGVAVLAVSVAIAWRFVSRRQALPCPAWLGWLVELDNPFTRINRAANIVAKLDLQPGMVVLDAGCGPGRLTVPIAQKVGDQGHVVAMDIQASMLDRVREKTRAAHLDNVRFLHAGLGEGRLERHQFDRALLVTVLGEIPEREAAFKELLSALKTSGTLSVFEVVFDPHFQSRRTVTRLARAVGFRDKAFYGSRLAYTVIFEKSGDESF